MGPTERSPSTEWDEVTRRYRRNPGGWWWLALLLVPLLLALGGLAFGGDDDAVTGAGAGEATSETTSSATETETDAAAGAPSAFAIAREGDQVTVTAEVPDEESKTALLDAVQGNAGEGVEVVDEVTIVDGASALDPMRVAALMGVDAAPGYEYSFDGETVTLTGEVPDEEAKSRAEAAAAELVPDAAIDNQLVVASGDDLASADCSQLQANIEALLAEREITFSSGGSRLDAESEQLVADIAELAAICPEATLAVGGHTDSTGSEAVNARLSEERAKAVADALVAAGVDPANVTSKGYGASEPIESNDTAEGRAANRRVEITVGEES